MRVLITGGRDFNNPVIIYKTLNAVHKKYGISCIIQGGATGADAFAKAWAIDYNVPFENHPADWKNLDIQPCFIKTGKYGKYNAMAGTNRNTFMLEERFPDMCIAFEGGNGTADMVAKVKKTSLPILEVKTPEIPF